MSKSPRRRRARKVGVRPSYPRPSGPHPTGKLPAASRAAATLGLMPFNLASAPETQRRDDRSRALSDALNVLKQLTVEREEPRRDVVEHDEHIRSAVARLRLDGANWGQIGTVLGISRQGARQRFDPAARAARRIRPVHREGTANHDDVARPDA